MTPIENYIIAGATGRQGGAVVAALLSGEFPAAVSSNIFAITRDAAGESATRLVSRFPQVKLLVGDLADPQAIFAQLDADSMSKTAIFLAQSHGPKEVSDAKAVIDAAAASGVPHFVYSSVDRGGKEMSDRDPSYCKTFSDKYEIEKYLINRVAQDDSSLKSYTILRPVWFIDNTDWGFPGRLCMAGWRYVMAGKRLQVVATKDIGRWAAEALVQPDRTNIRNEAVSIASDQLTFHELDEIYTQETGNHVLLANWLLAKIMIWLIPDLRTMFAFIGERDYGADLSWLNSKLEPTTFKMWAATKRT